MYFTKKLLSLLIIACLCSNTSGSQHPSANTWNRLLRAIEQGEIKEVKEIVPSQIQANAITRGEKKKSLLQIATHHNRPAIVAYLQSKLPSQPETSTGAQVAARTGVIEFYHKKDPYYEFTNFYQGPNPIKLDGELWESSEHYFQAKKFRDDPKLQKRIQSASSPRKAFDIAKENAQFKRSDWEAAKLGIMDDVLLAKFTQDPRLKKLLLDTENEYLIEASPVDSYWGYGPNKTGENMLGHALMKLRSELRAKLIDQANAGSAGTGSSSSMSNQSSASLAGTLNMLHASLTNLAHKMGL